MRGKGSPAPVRLSPSGAVGALVPTIEHTGASIDPAIGTANDFSEPKTFTVKAEDGGEQAYQVTVTVSEK